MKLEQRFRSLWVPTIAILLISELAAEVVIEARPAPLQVNTGIYEGTVDGDGCLTNLRVDGHEFLAAGVNISRGSYFYQAGPLRLSKLEQPSPHEIVATSEPASIRYQFDEQSMVWTLENLSQESMVFFLVFTDELQAVRDQSGKIRRASIATDTTELTCFRDGVWLTVKGLNKVWGPWEGNHQVAHVDLAAGERKQLRLQVGRTSPAELEQIAGLFAPPPEKDLTLLSPRNYQVFQRQTVEEGEILISGRCQQKVDSIAVRIAGNSAFAELPSGWQTMTPVSKLHEFNLRLALPAGGWYALELQAKHSGNVVAETTVEKFGVGEVFVGAGQSNSTNCGQFKTTQSSGMVSSFGGSHWQLADDPQPGAADKSQGGSFWPAFGDAMHEKYQVPIGVAVTGFGGTSVNRWQPDDDLFEWMMKRVGQLGPTGFRALLWHQGESDVGMASEEYYAKLRNVIATSRDQAGWEFPWLVAQATYHNAEKPQDDAIRKAQQRLWDDRVALRGPDTDTLIGDHRDFEGQGIHFSPQGLKAHGEMWAERVAVYLDEALRLEPQPAH